MGVGVLLNKIQIDSLIPGEMPELQFWLLIELSPMHSEKVILALKDFLVVGSSRKDVCERYNVSPGYFSGALGKIKHVNMTVMQLIPYYFQGKPKS